MRNLKGLVVLVCLLFVGYAAQAQAFSNRGREFWVGYGHHQFMEDGSNTQQMVLYLYTGDSAAVVTVKLEGSGSLIPPPTGGPWTRTYTIPANTVISIEDPMPAGVNVTKSPTCIQAVGPIPKGAAGDCGFDARLYTCPPPTCTGGEGVFKKKGIHITSTASIVAYSHIYGSFSSGATMLMPVSTWGYNYTTINSDQNSATDSYSWMYVIANDDNTWIRITPSVPSRNGRPAGVPFDTVLNRGEIYQLVGKLTSASAGFNLTGTTVRSINVGTGICHPIAVFAGSSRTGGEPPCDGGGRDNDMQQLFPEQAWGKRYLTAPFSNSSSASSLMNCVYKVAVTDPTTIVKRNGVTLSGLILGKYYKFASTTADYIEADKPIMVAQFMGGGCVSGDGDPEMVYLSPIEQSIKDIGFYRNSKEAINTQYLTLIVPTPGVSTLKIDGTLFSAIPAASKHSYPHPNLPGYTVCIRRWNPATKAASTAKSDSAFTAITYGEGGAESYGYNAGTFLNNLNALPFIKNELDTAKQSPFTCTGTSVEISALLAYKPTQIIWKLSQVKHLFRAINQSPVLTDTTTGTGSVLMIPTDSFFVNNRWYYRYSLNFYQFDSLGTYEIPLTVKNPNSITCNPFEDFSLKIEVKQKPIADFTFALPGCPTDSVKFFGAGSGGGYTIRGWFWEFPQGTPSADSSQNTGYVFPGPGIYNVKLTVASNEGCSTDTVKTVTIAPGVTTSFTVSPNTLCEGGTVTITPGPTTTTEWYWDFGDGTGDTLYNGNPFTHTYAGYGVFTISHSIKSSGTCNISAVPQTVTVNANPFATFTIAPPGCLPANGVVQFTSTATAPDGQAINAHAWNFGDPNATVPNPNVSSLASPTHQYSVVGPYIIQYRATTVNGCFKDTTVNTVFNITPAVTYPALANVCFNTPAYNVNTGSVTNGVPVTEYYSGPGITNAATGLFDPSLAGVGTHTIWYHATSTVGNCTDSVSQTVTVNALPFASFTFPTICLPNSTVQFTDNSTGGTTYSWNFDEPSSGANNTSASQNPTHTYSGSGPYNVKLTVTGNGCSKDTTIPVVVKVQPVLSYPPLAAVCGNVAPFAINTATVTNGVSGTGTYSGPGITNGTTGILDPSIAGVGTHTIKYIFTSTLGCVDSISQTIGVNTIPFASFTFPTNCLPNGNVQFTNNSTGGTTYSWDFGDGSSTVSTTSPVHTYTGSGPYNVKLTVTGNGCSKDTTIAVTVKVQPTLTFASLAPVCGNNPILFVNAATVTNGVAGTGIYSGNGITNGATGAFDPSIAGIGTHTIKYIFTSSLGCVDSATQTITVNVVPFASFTFPTNCLPNGNVQFTNNSTGGTIYNWDFGDGSPNVSTTSPIHTYTGSGPYNVKLAVTGNGCSKDTTIPVTVRVKPILSYPALSAVCANVPQFSIDSAVVTNGVTGTGVYSGPGITNGATGAFDPAITGVGTFNIKYIFTSSLGCVDSISRSITVKVVPFASFTFPTNCLPNGNVQFTNNSTGGTTYFWNFGDGSPTLGTTSPLHTYIGSGPFNVILTVTGNGCSKDTTIAVTVKIKPTLSFPALGTVCANNPVLSVNTATVTNGVTGTGVYSGSGITNGSTGSFNPSIAGVGTHTIKYIFTSSLGCVDSVSQTITVNAVPFSSFGFPTNCLPNSNVQFTNNSTGGTTYSWDFGDGSPTVGTTSPIHTYTGSGPYNVKLTVTGNGCSKDTTIAVTVKVQPTLSYPPIAPVCANVPAFAVNTATVTNGVTGTGVYSGNGITNGTTGTFNPSVAGIGTHNIKYIFSSTLGCVDSVQSSVVVKGVPVAGFTFPTTCLVNGTVNFTDTSKVPVGTPGYTWNFGEPSSGALNTSVVKNAQHSYSGSGPFPVKLVVSVNGCADSTTKPVLVRVQPQLNFPVPASVCANISAYSIATGTVTNGMPGNPKYKGVGITDTLLGIFNPSTAGVGTHNVTFYYTTLLGCIDSVTRQIIVKSVPVSSFTYPTGCLPNSTVQFTNTSVPASGATYLWNFGDAGSPTNTSTAVSPTHLYNVFGSYNIKLTVTANGCIDDTTIRATFRLQPVINFPALPSVCHADDTVAVNTATVTNGVPGKGKYSGTGIIDTLGMFNPLVAGAGTHVITYTFTSDSGCIATKTSSITVWPRPVITRIGFNNIPDSNICIDKALVISSQVLIASGTVIKWEWNLGNGVDTLFNTSANFNYTYDTPLSYIITLTAFSNNGCASVPLSRLVNIRALPVVSFTSPVGVCMPNGSVQFNNTSVIPLENTNTLSYVWNFGDGSSPTAVVDPVHIYNSTLPQADVILTATSAYGCKSADTATILFYPKPIAAYTALPYTLCQGKQVTFTNLTTSPNIASATWNFGDGTSPSTAISPVVTYQGTGEFPTTLVVASTNGCRDTAKQKIRVYVQPVVDAGKSFVVNAGTVITLQGNVNAPNLTYNWSPATGLSNASILNPTTTALANRTYTLTATGQGGCTDSDTMTVNILLALKIPNAFSPNGDGINDTWDIGNLKDYPASSVEVFNRYGQSVYLSNGRYTKSWDGTFKGNKLPNGTYYYIVDVKNGAKPIAGNVTIIK